MINIASHTIAITRKLLFLAIKLVATVEIAAIIKIEIKLNKGIIIELLSYKSQMNSGDKNDIITEKNIMHTIKNSIPVSALKNSFTKNIVSLITK